MKILLCTFFMQMRIMDKITNNLLTWYKENQRDLPSFEMEQKIADLLHYPQYGLTNYTDYLLKVLKEFYGDFEPLVKSAFEKMEKAAGQD